jgi:hypothetical protein
VLIGKNAVEAGAEAPPPEAGQLQKFETLKHMTTRVVAAER